MGNCLTFSSFRWRSRSYEESDEKRVNTNTHRGIDRAAYEGDIASRLKHWRGLHLAHSGELFEEAASEIERLRTLAAHTTPHEGSVQAQCTLTDEEREAIEWCVEMATVHAMECDDELVTLRNLLERFK